MDVLIAEDEPLVALNLELLLQDNGYTVLGPVATAKEAIVLAATRPPHVALLDLNLADGFRGLELAQHLAQTYSAVVIVLTGNPQLVSAGNPHVYAVLAKPALDDLVLQSLARVRQERALR